MRNTGAAHPVLPCPGVGLNSVVLDLTHASKHSNAVRRSACSSNPANASPISESILVAASCSFFRFLKLSSLTLRQIFCFIPILPRCDSRSDVLKSIDLPEGRDDVAQSRCGRKHRRLALTQWIRQVGSNETAGQRL